MTGAEKKELLDWVAKLNGAIDGCFSGATLDEDEAISILEDFRTHTREMLKAEIEALP